MKESLKATEITLPVVKEKSVYMFLGFLGIQKSFTECMLGVRI
jgi:hypothetical protein